MEADARNARIEELAPSAAAGNERALDELLRLVEPLVQQRCRTILPNALDAEEAAQDALVNVTRRIGTFDGRSKFGTWLYRVASNSAIDTYRKLKRRAQSGYELPEITEDRRTSVIAGTRIDLLDAMEGMDGKFAEPVALRDLHGLDYAEISEALDVPVGTVKSRIAEGRRRLQHLLSL